MWIFSELALCGMQTPQRPPWPLIFSKRCKGCSAWADMIARTISSLTLAIVCAASFAQQVLPTPQLPAATVPVETGSHRPVLTVTIPKRPAPAAVVIHVSVDGFDNGDGSQSRPFKTLTRAQEAVRLINATNSV